MPEIERRVPQHLQVAGYYKRQILDGEIRSGDRIPSVRDIMAQWKVSHQTAQRAIEYLSKVEGLVRTGPDGTFVNGHRVKYGPQQRARAKHFPATEREEVLAAGMAEAPPYIVPILGLLEAWPGFFPVLRREWVTYENGDIPFLLTVSWCMPESASAVPELLNRSRLPDPAGAASLIAARTGREEPVGRFAFEPRPPKEDGREIPLLRLPPGDWVGAVVSTWTSGEAVIEYREEVSTRHVIEFGPE